MYFPSEVNESMHACMLVPMDVSYPDVSYPG